MPPSDPFTPDEPEDLPQPPAPRRLDPTLPLPTELMEAFGVTGRAQAPNQIDPPSVRASNAQTAWTPGVDMQDTRSGFAAAVVGGQIYVAGGEVLELSGFIVRDTVERFDPVAGQWHYEAMLPVQLHGTGAVGLGNRMLIFGERHLRRVLATYAVHYVRHEAPLTMWR